MLAFGTSHKLALVLLDWQVSIATSHYGDGQLQFMVFQGRCRGSALKGERAIYIRIIYISVHYDFISILAWLQARQNHTDGEVADDGSVSGGSVVGGCVCRPYEPRHGASSLGLGLCVFTVPGRRAS